MNAETVETVGIGGLTMSVMANTKLKKALLEFVIDHLKHFRAYPMEFEYRNKVYNFKQILSIIKNRK